MRFVIEQRHLTDVEGRPVKESGAVSFHNIEAENVDDVIELHVKRESGELLGDVLKFPGFQAVATLRNLNGVFTLQVMPASQQYVSRS